MYEHGNVTSSLSASFVIVVKYLAFSNYSFEDAFTIEGLLFPTLGS